MRKLLFLPLLIMALGSFAQTKGNTKIIIVNELSAKENFKKAVELFLDKDFLIEANENINYIVTKPQV